MAGVGKLAKLLVKMGQKDLVRNFSKAPVKTTLKTAGKALIWPAKQGIARAHMGQGLKTVTNAAGEIDLVPSKFYKYGAILAGTELLGSMAYMMAADNAEECFGGFGAGMGTLGGFVLGGPIGAVIGGASGYFIGKSAASKPNEEIARHEDVTEDTSKKPESDVPVATESDSIATDSVPTALPADSVATDSIATAPVTAPTDSVPATPVVPVAPNDSVPTDSVPRPNIPVAPTDSVPADSVPRPNIPAVPTDSVPAAPADSIPTPPAAPADSIPARPTVPTDSIPAKPTVPADSIPAQPAQPTAPVQPAQPATPAGPAQPAQQTPPTNNIFGGTINGITTASHDVVKGDCLWNIAKHYLREANPGATITNGQILAQVKEFVRLNPQIKNPDLIYPNQQIKMCA